MCRKSFLNFCDVLTRLRLFIPRLKEVSERNHYNFLALSTLKHLKKSDLMMSYRIINEAVKNSTA